MWQASASDAGGPSADLAPLSAAERARAGRFVFERDRALYVLGKRMTRTLLARALGAEPAALEFAAAAHGKPELAGPWAGSGVRFNLAHSGDRVLVAVGRGRRVGIDVERQRAALDLRALARRFFCQAENALIEAAAPDEARRLFFKFWTLKEAYLKAEGSGLAIRLNAIDASGVPDDELAAPCAPVEDQPRAILVQRLPAPEGYAAAVAADGHAWHTAVRAWRAGDFVASSR